MLEDVTDFGPFNQRMNEEKGGPKHYVVDEVINPSFWLLHYISTTRVDRLISYNLIQELVRMQNDE